MNASLLSFNRRGLRLSSLALAGATLLAACDTDRPLEPTTAAGPVTPNLKKGANTGALMITIVDQNNTLPTTAGAQATVATWNGGKTYFAVDNGPGDTHSTIGVILLVNLPAGYYNVCQTVAPVDYVLPTPPACFPIEVIAGTAQVGDASHVQFQVLTAPRVKWIVEDPINGDHPAGAVFTGDVGSGTFTIADNSPIDLDPAAGSFEVKVDGDSIYLCTDTPPAGFVFHSQSQGCMTVPVTAGQTTTLPTPFMVRPYASAYWDAAVSGVFVEGSEYLITAASGGFSAAVVNDGLNDSMKGMRLYVKLPAPGWYTVCQTVAPAKAQLADPVCVRIDVSFGHPQYAGTFDSKPL